MYHHLLNTDHQMQNHVVENMLTMEFLGAMSTRTEIYNKFKMFFGIKIEMLQLPLVVRHHLLMRMHDN